MKSTVTAFFVSAAIALSSATTFAAQNQWASDLTLDYIWVNEDGEILIRAENTTCAAVSIGTATHSTFKVLYTHPGKSLIMSQVLSAVVNRNTVSIEFHDEKNACVVDGIKLY